MQVASVHMHMHNCYKCLLFVLYSFVTIFHKDNGIWMYFVDMINTQNANPQSNTQNATNTQ